MAAANPNMMAGMGPTPQQIQQQRMISRQMLLQQQQQQAQQQQQPPQQQVRNIKMSSIVFEKISFFQFQKFISSNNHKIWECKRRPSLPNYKDNKISIHINRNNIDLNRMSKIKSQL